MTFQKITLILLAGAVGGILRGLLGIAKSLALKKKFEISWTWLFVSIFVSAILGMITATFFLDDIKLALIGGYAGSDFLGGLMRIMLKNKFNYLQPKQLSKQNKSRKSGFGELMKNK